MLSLSLSVPLSCVQEAIKKICSWEYANCIDLWVMFISANIRDYDIQPLCYMAIQLINGVANLFPGPRYFPLRLRCIQWLNKLSSSSGIFIPVTSFVLDLLEYKIGKEDGKPGKSINFPPLLKVIKKRHSHFVYHHCHQFPIFSIDLKY